MAKFNKTQTIKTENRSGHVAYKMSDKEQLVTAVLTTMFGEPKYYGSTDNEIVRLATECAVGDPGFLCRLACYARQNANLRSVSHVLTCVIARNAHEYTRRTVRNTVIRPDDITEIMACYLDMYGKPFPNALKREIGECLQKFDEYQLAKYNGGNKALKLRDVLRIVHPVPKTGETEALFGKILNGTLETPYTWETELSARGNTKEVWNELIASGKVGYMALLRNMRNIVRSGADIAPVLATIADPQKARASRQLPFRFYSAYLALKEAGLINRKMTLAFESAIRATAENIETIPGRTLIAVDVSGSMGSPISKKSDVKCCDIASLMGAMAARICEEATVVYFDSENGWSCNGKEGYRTAHYGRSESILDIAVNNAFRGGGTDLALPMKYALTKDVAVRPFDRVIYFSDNECNRTFRDGRQSTAQSYVDEYRRKFNPDLWVHAVDLQGYGTQQFCGRRYNLIAGWSEQVLSFINLAEKGMGSLIEEIEKLETV